MQCKPTYLNKKMKMVRLSLHHSAGFGEIRSHVVEMKVEVRKMANTAYSSFNKEVFEPFSLNTKLKCGFTSGYTSQTQLP